MLGLCDPVEVAISHSPGMSICSTDLPQSIKWRSSGDGFDTLTTVNKGECIQYNSRSSSQMADICAGVNRPFLEAMTSIRNVLGLRELPLGLFLLTIFYFLEPVSTADDWIALESTNHPNRTGEYLKLLGEMYAPSQSMQALEKVASGCNYTTDIGNKGGRAHKKGASRRKKKADSRK